ncbi:MAG: ABC transporter ATP-binding protein [Rhodospirillaceae bacterium]|nr:ABC transporter ATP-binding protein [Rhodospirillaceae bacterium]
MNNNQSPPITVLVADGVGRQFKQMDQIITVIRDSSFSMSQGEIVGLLGPSGSGKSTLLHLCGLLEKPDQGKIEILGQSVNELNDNQRSLFRQNHLGFVYQYHHLQKDFSALENVMIPQLIAGHSKREAQKKAADLLSQVNLSHRLHHRPGKLSGGEQQRVAIARALVNSPQILLADEPTGNLDTKTTEEVFLLLKNLAKAMNLSAIIATHNLDLAKRMDRIMRVEDGVIHQL